MYIVYHCCSSVITAILFFFYKFAYGGGVGVEGDWNY